MTGDEVLYIKMFLTLFTKHFSCRQEHFDLTNVRKTSQRFPLSFVPSDLTVLSTRRLLRGPQHCQHINALYLGLVFTVKGSIIQRLRRAEGVKKCSSVHLIFLDHLSN